MIKKKPKTKALTKPRKKIGRPSKLEGVDFLQVQDMASRGATDKQIYEALGMSEKTFYTHKLKSKEFSQALEKGRTGAIDFVENALYLRATGYSHPDLFITQHKGEIVKEQIIKHYPPDPTSMIFYLKNKRPEVWKDKHEHALDEDQLELILNLGGKK